MNSNNYINAHESEDEEQGIDLRLSMFTTNSNNNESPLTQTPAAIPLSSLPSILLTSPSRSLSDRQSSHSNGNRSVRYRTPSPSQQRRVSLARTPSHSEEETPDPSERCTITPPFPWSKDVEAKVLSLEELKLKNIKKIKGDVYCKDCHNNFSVEFDLMEKFNLVGTFIAQNKEMMRDRAPKKWMNPALLKCSVCDKNSVKPVISENKEEINWLFLLLGEMLGFCTLDQLKYFCKFTKNHRTGAKDRVLYLTYLGICKQLDETGPFDPPSVRPRRR